MSKPFEMAELLESDELEAAEKLLQVAGQLFIHLESLVHAPNYITFGFTLQDGTERSLVWGRPESVHVTEPNS